MAIFEEEKKEYSQPRTMRQAIQQAVTARGAGLQPATTDPPAQQQQTANASPLQQAFEAKGAGLSPRNPLQQPPANANPVQTDPTAPAGYNLGKKVGGMIGGLKEGMDARVNRQIDLVTAAPRAAMQFGGNVVRGMRGDAPNTEEFKVFPSASPPAAPQPSANMGAFRQVEAQNPEPGRLGAMLSARGNRQADAMLYGDGEKIVGGNSPQAAAAMPPPSPNVRPTTGMAPGGWMRNEQTGEVLTIGANRGAKMGMVDAQGNSVIDVSKVSGRVPVGQDGRPIRAGAGLTTGGRYSFQGTQDAAQKFVGAVSPGEYSPEAVAARDMQNKQFLTRQGYEEVDPVTGMTASQQRALPVKERVALAGARLQAKTAADSNAVNRLQAEGNLELGRGNLAVSQAQQATQAKGAGLDMAAKQMEIDNARANQDLMSRYTAAMSDPKAKPEDVKTFEKQMIARGIYKPPQDSYTTVKRQTPGTKENPMGGEEIVVINSRTGEQVRTIGRQGAARPDDHRFYAGFEKLKRDFKERFGYLPEGV